MFCRHVAPYPTDQFTSHCLSRLQPALDPSLPPGGNNGGSLGASQSISPPRFVWIDESLRANVWLERNYPIAEGMDI